ncbi:MAG: hypothetical protein WEC12_02855 [Balneolaceae bacterium]
MRNPVPPAFRPVAAGLLTGLVSLSIPLLRDFHWESAGLAALTATFYAAVLSAKEDNSPSAVLRKTTGMLMAWACPLLLFALATGCFSPDGLAYWLLGPFPSMLFGWSAGRLFRLLHFRNPLRITLSVLLVTAVIPTVIEFLVFPQLFFFNHVWSYWPGPIYDELVPFDPRLISFRVLTLLWAVTLWALPGFFREKLYKWFLLPCAAGLLFSYMNLTNLGLIMPEEQIQRELGAMHETDHFRIYYNTGTLNEDEIERFGEKHEEHLVSITDILEIDRTVYRKEKIHSYVYSDISQKKRLTGAGQTSYVPVWISQDQTHIAFRHLDQVLKHELVHIAAKNFGNWFGASTSIGLIEGLAVALDPNRYHSTPDQLVAAGEDLPGPEDLQELFSPVGFYGMAGPVSYVISGSFVGYLLENYPVDMFKTAYRTGNIGKAYAPYSVKELAGTWRQHLKTVDTEAADRRRAVALFSTPSIFEKPCPRIEKKRDIRQRFSMGMTGPGETARPGTAACEKRQ